MNKFSKILRKAHQFAKMAEVDQKDYFNKVSQTRDLAQEEKGLLLEPNDLFRHVANLKNALLNAVGNVRSANQVLREQQASEDTGKIEHDFSSTYGRTFIKACYDAFPDLDGAIESQDPRKLHLLKAENAVKSLGVVVNQLQRLGQSSLNDIVKGLSLQLSSAKTSLGKIYEFQQQKSKHNRGNVSNQDRAMLGVKDFYSPDEVKNPWEDKDSDVSLMDKNKKRDDLKTPNQKALNRIPNS